MEVSRFSNYPHSYFYYVYRSFQFKYSFNLYILLGYFMQVPNYFIDNKLYLENSSNKTSQGKKQ